MIAATFPKIPNNDCCSLCRYRLSDEPEEPILPVLKKLPTAGQVKQVELQKARRVAEISRRYLEETKHTTSCCSLM